MQPALAIFGGTFDPIHFGHLRAAQEVSDSFGLERVIFMPCAQPAHIKDVRASTAQRLRMIALAIAGNSRFEVSDLEARRPGSSYAVDTLLELGKMHPGRGLLSILGADAFFQIHTWRQAERLFQLADFVVIDRPGTPRYNILTYLQDNINPDFEAYGDRGALLAGGGRVNYLTTTLLDISSSEIKRKAGKGQALTYLMPPEVEEYIKNHDLYK